MNKMETGYEEKIDRYIELYDEVREKTDTDSAAVAILQEMGKDRRSKHIREEKATANYEPATEKQRRFMKRLGISIPAAVTKKEASILLDEELKAVD